MNTKSCVLVVKSVTQLGKNWCKWGDIFGGKWHTCYEKTNCANISAVSLTSQLVAFCSWEIDEFFSVLKILPPRFVCTGTQSNEQHGPKDHVKTHKHGTTYGTTTRNPTHSKGMILFRPLGLFLYITVGYFALFWLNFSNFSTALLHLF